MGKKGQHHHPIIFKQARRAAIGKTPTAPVAEVVPPAQVFLEEQDRGSGIFSFNWGYDARVSPLEPRLLEDDECPQFEGALRDYVDCTARGLHPDKKLEEEIDRRFSSREQTDAFKEGIRRWHTFPPGKERR